MRLALILLTLPLFGQFNFSAPTWADRATGKATLAYCISTYPATPPRAEVDQQIQAALREWSKYVEITFAPGTCGAERTLTFAWVADDHGDGYPFERYIVAHSYYPPPLHQEPLAGDIHFRASYDWTPPLEIYVTALHEIGHALGVWSARGGVMDDGSWYRHLTLQTPDIIDVRQHYAKRCVGVECAWGLRGKGETQWQRSIRDRLSPRLITRRGQSNSLRT